MRRARDLHRRALVVDAHADTLTEMTDRGYDLDAAPRAEGEARVVVVHGASEGGQR